MRRDLRRRGGLEEGIGSVVAVEIGKTVWSGALCAALALSICRSSKPDMTTNLICSFLASVKILVSLMSSRPLSIVSKSVRRLVRGRFNMRGCFECIFDSSSLFASGMSLSELVSSNRFFPCGVASAAISSIITCAKWKSLTVSVAPFSNTKNSIRFSMLCVSKSEDSDTDEFDRE